MVFSFFKKQPEKMIARQPVVPRPATGSKETPAPSREVQRDDTPASATVATDEEAGQSSQFSNLDFRFSESSLDFQVNAEADPVNEPAEEAAILFANNQDQAAQAVLEGALKPLPSGPAERLWMMLFDLYRLSGQQSAFEAMGIEYARTFEKSPPVWSGASSDSTMSAAGDGGSMLFRGELIAKNTAAFDLVRRALEKSGSLRLDVAKVKQLDPEGCELLLDLMAHAKKNRGKLDLRGRDSLIKLVQNRVAASRENPVPDKGCWLLLLELLQQKGQQEVFEEAAIDYAVTFEESPPSWDAARAAKPASGASLGERENSALVFRGDGNGDIYFLSGEIRSSHFADLPAFAQKQDILLFDCNGLKRIDFSSTGALLNLLIGVRNAGKQIIVRHPNYLVAELFRVVGLDAVANIVNAK